MTTTQYIQYYVVQMESTRSRYSLSLIHQSNINRDEGSEYIEKNPHLIFKHLKTDSYIS